MDNVPMFILVLAIIIPADPAAGYIAKAAVETLKKVALNVDPNTVKAAVGTAGDVAFRVGTIGAGVLGSWYGPQAAFGTWGMKANEAGQEAIQPFRDAGETWGNKINAAREHVKGKLPNFGGGGGGGGGGDQQN